MSVVDPQPSGTRLAITLALAAGASLVDAARMATYAAAIVVMKRGTATASPGEVRALIEDGDE